MMTNACETRRKFNEAIYQYEVATRPLWQAVQEGLSRSRRQEVELKTQLRKLTTCLKVTALRPSTTRVLRKELQLLEHLLEECSREVQAWEELISGIDRGYDAANEDQWAVQF